MQPTTWRPSRRPSSRRPWMRRCSVRTNGKAGTTACPTWDSTLAGRARRRWRASSRNASIFPIAGRVSSQKLILDWSPTIIFCDGNGRSFAPGLMSSPYILALFPKYSLHICIEPPSATPTSTNVNSVCRYFEKYVSYTSKYETHLSLRSVSLVLNISCSDCITIKCPMRS